MDIWGINKSDFTLCVWVTCHLYTCKQHHCRTFYISQLALEHLGVPPQELFEAARERIFWTASAARTTCELYCIVASLLLSIYCQNGSNTRAGQQCLTLWLCKKIWNFWLVPEYPVLCKKWRCLIEFWQQHSRRHIWLSPWKYVPFPLHNNLLDL